MKRICLLLMISVITFFSCKKNKVDDGSLINIIIDSSASLVVLKESDYRPVYHFTPPTKWMNDPNGLVFYKGKYHLFYQYNPNSSVWGPMHWGHATSTDLFNWKDHAIALAPDNTGTIFSGSAVVDVNNTSGFKSGVQDPLVAIYTLAGSQQHQSIAHSNDGGMSWQKFSGNPILTNPGIPDFRDPKVFWHPAKQKWMMALAVGNKISFYSSVDLKSWVFESNFGENLGAHGGVWECPDLFEIPVEGTNITKWVLLVSINPGGPNGGSATQYFVGNFDGKTFTSETNETLWLDYGTDNYAGVTYNNIPSADGRRLLIGWMSNWNYAQNTPTTSWRSTMTVPRELTLKSKSTGNYVLKSKPAKEFANYASSTSDTSIVAAKKTIQILDNKIIKSGSYEINFSVNLNSVNKTMLTLGNKSEKLTISLDKESRQIVIDRASSGHVSFNEDFKKKINCSFVPKTDGMVDVQILIDKTSVELFIDGGEKAMTALFFPMYQYNLLKLEGDGNAEIITKFKLQGISKSLVRNF